MAPATLPDAKITIQDGGLGVQGPTATGVFGAIGVAATLPDSSRYGKIIALSSPRTAHDTLGPGPLRDLVVAALSRAATVVHAIPLARGSGAMAGRVRVVSQTLLPSSSGTLSVTDDDPDDSVTSDRIYVITADGANNINVTGGAGGVTGGPGLVKAVDGLEFTATSPTAGDMWTARMARYDEAPQASYVAALDTLLADGAPQIEWISIAGESLPSRWAWAAARMAAAANRHRYLHCKLQAPFAHTSAAAWQTAVDAWSKTGATTGRVQVYAAWVRMVDDIDGSTRIRGLSEAGAGLSARRLTWEPIDAVRYGPIPGVTALYPDDLGDGQIAAINARDYVVARHYAGLRGTYIARSNMLSEPGSDYGVEERRRVMDRACTVVRAAQLQYLNSSVQLAPDGTLAGIALFRAISQQPLDEMVSSGAISAGAVTIDPTQDLLSSERLEVEISIVPRGKIGSISTTIAFANPVLLRLQAGQAPETATEEEEGA